MCSPASSLNRCSSSSDGWGGPGAHVGMTCAARGDPATAPALPRPALCWPFFWRRSSLQACSVQGPAAPASGVERFSAQRLPGAPGEELWALQRGPAGATPALPRRWSFLGSGCAGIGPFADRYFRGLLHAQVTVLHEPGLHPADTTPAADCPARFVQADHLSAWANSRARRATAGHYRARSLSCQRAMAAGGYFEGVELLPSLAASTGPGLAGLVMMAGQWAGPA